MNHNNNDKLIDKSSSLHSSDSKKNRIPFSNETTKTLGDETFSDLIYTDSKEQPKMLNTTSLLGFSK